MIEQEFFEKMAAVWKELSILQEHVTRLEGAMGTIERLGMTNATIHKRSDNGGMELLHPTGSDYERQTGRRREYIGKKPEAQQAAQERVNRYHEYCKLKNEWSKQAERRVQIYRQIERLEITALGKQAKFFSEVGTNQSSAAAQIVPTDYTRLTPKFVVDHFRQSPILAGIADDVEQVLGKVEWAQVQKAA